jgi:uncharacterized membrane protein YhaH (DUF805 family)
MSEQAVNPYAAPRAAVADIYDGDPGVQPVKLWSAKGRIGRARFLAYTFYSYLLFIVAAFVVGAVIGFAGTGGAEGAIGLVMLVISIPYFVFYVLMGIQRSHDMNWSGWMLLLALIPLVALIWVFKSGSQGSNRFGAPPPPNTTSVLIGAWLMPILFVLGIVAAIALPAYQQYANRAVTSQVEQRP